VKIASIPARTGVEHPGQGYAHAPHSNTGGKSRMLATI